MAKILPMGNGKHTSKQIKICKSSNKKILESLANSKVGFGWAGFGAYAQFGLRLGGGVPTKFNHKLSSKA